MKKNIIQEFYTEANVADMLGVSKKNASKYLNLGTKSKKGFVHVSAIENLDKFQSLVNTNWDKEFKTTPSKNYKSIEIFAGAGGLAIGLDKAGFESILLNDFDKDSCDTLSRNRNWHVEHDDVTNLSFKKYNTADII